MTSHKPKLIKGRVTPFLHKVVLRRANQPHNFHEDRFSMLWPSRTQSPPKSQITMVKVSGKHIWCHQICLPDTLTIVIWLLGGDCVRLGQSIEKRSSWELWGWFALLKTTLCKKGGTLPLRLKCSSLASLQYFFLEKNDQHDQWNMLNLWCTKKWYENFEKGEIVPLTLLSAHVAHSITWVSQAQVTVQTSRVFVWMLLKCRPVGKLWFFHFWNVPFFENNVL